MVFVGSSPKLLLWLLVLRNLFGSGFAAETTGTNIYAVIVSSSRYWFNYRHAMNALGIYQLLKGNGKSVSPFVCFQKNQSPHHIIIFFNCTGVPDSQIVLMIADEYATNARNPFKNEMYANGRAAGTWYSNETEIDYRGADVTVQNFMNAVLGTSPKSLEMTNSESKVLIYLTGHGGDQFFKFQDEEELTARDIANLADELYRRKKFDQALWIAGECTTFNSASIRLQFP